MKAKVPNGFSCKPSWGLACRSRALHGDAVDRGWAITWVGHTPWLGRARYKSRESCLLLRPSVY